MRSAKFEMEREEWSRVDAEGDIAWEEGKMGSADVATELPASNTDIAQSRPQQANNGMKIANKDK